MSETLKTKVISFNRNNGLDNDKELFESLEVVDSQYKESIFRNTTARVPHVTRSISETILKQPKLETDFKKVANVNEHYASFPKFYLREFKYYQSLVVFWIVMVFICFSLCSYAAYRIINNPQINNWVILVLVPWPILVFALLIVAISNYLNFRAEAKVVDFSKEKIVTKNIKKLYLRLKTGYINVNWMSGLSYVLCALTIAINYLVALIINTTEFQDGKIIIGAIDLNKVTDGNILFSCGGPIQFIVLIVASVIGGITFILHISLIVTNYVRANQIDSFFAVQIVSDEELTTLKKYKNKRDLIIFFAITSTLILAIILIFKSIKKHSKKEITVTV